LAVGLAGSMLRNEMLYIFAARDEEQQQYYMKIEG
jgi:hypothetical protein